jgi:hypothetical protein
MNDEGPGGTVGDAPQCVCSPPAMQMAPVPASPMQEPCAPPQCRPRPGSSGSDSLRPRGPRSAPEVASVPHLGGPSPAVLHHHMQCNDREREAGGQVDSLSPYSAYTPPATGPGSSLLAALLSSQGRSLPQDRAGPPLGVLLPPPSIPWRASCAAAALQPPHRCRWPAQRPPLLQLPRSQFPQGCGCIHLAHGFHCGRGAASGVLDSQCELHRDRGVAGAGRSGLGSRGSGGVHVDGPGPVAPVTPVTVGPPRFGWRPPTLTTSLSSPGGPYAAAWPPAPASSQVMPAVVSPCVVSASVAQSLGVPSCAPGASGGAAPRAPSTPVGALAAEPGQRSSELHAMVAACVGLSRASSPPWGAMGGRPSPPAPSHVAPVREPVPPGPLEAAVLQAAPIVESPCASIVGLEEMRVLHVSVVGTLQQPCVSALHWAYVWLPSGCV